jgi:site-specific DNA recombinase
MNQESKKRKTVVLYARTANSMVTDPRHSICGQLEVLREYAREHYYVVVGEYYDVGASGRTFDRPAFREMMKFILEETGTVDAIFVVNQSRFSRSLPNGMAMRKRLERKGVNVIFLDDHNNDPLTCRFIDEMLKAIYNHVPDSFADTVRRGMKENARRGFHNGGKATFGYRTVTIRYGSTERKHLEIDRERAPVIQQIFNMRLKGKATSEIADVINSQGARTSSGNEWNSAAVRRILSNEVYTSVSTWGKSRNVDGKRVPADPLDVIRVENNHPAIIDKDTFRKVQEKPGS